MSWDKSLGNNPEALDFQLVAHLGDGGGYEWCTFDVWRDLRTGSLRYAEDSGCSCNSPYENILTYQDAIEATELLAKDTEAQFVQDVLNFDPYGGYTDGTKKNEFLIKVHKLLLEPNKPLRAAIEKAVAQEEAVLKDGVLIYETLIPWPRRSDGVPWLDKVGHAVTHEKVEEGTVVRVYEVHA